MSVIAMSWVFKKSKSTLGERLVLLALADHANDEGRNAYPSLGTLAEKSRLCERQVRRCIRKLEKSGELTVEIGEGWNGTNMYTLTALADVKNVPPGNMSPGQIEHLGGTLACKKCPPNQEQPSVRTTKEATPEIPPAVKPRTDGKPNLREVDSFSWDDFHPTQAAHKLLEHLELPKARANHEAVTAALESLKRKMPLSEAFHFLLTRAFDGIAAGERVTQFWFTNASYKHAPGEKATKPKPKPKPAMTIQEVLARQKEGKF
jgi:hypothetical protein